MTETREPCDDTASRSGSAQGPRPETTESETGGAYPLRRGTFT